MGKRADERRLIKESRASQPDRVRLPETLATGPHFRMREDEDLPTDSKILGSFSSAGGLCSNSNCVKIVQTKCTTCELRFCYEHSKHPEHR
jgi:hypothetical protein